MTSLPRSASAAPLPPVSLENAFIRRTDLSEANLEGANLSGADLTNAIARRANFKNARLRNAVLRGTDLTGATGLTLDQIRESFFDETTIFPDYIDTRLLEFRKPYTD